jgi:hypothetical protein
VHIESHTTFPFNQSSNIFVVVDEAVVEDDDTVWGGVTIENGGLEYD